LTKQALLARILTLWLNALKARWAATKPLAKKFEKDCAWCHTFAEANNWLLFNKLVRPCSNANNCKSAMNHVALRNSASAIFLPNGWFIIGRIGISTLGVIFAKR